MYTEQRPKDVYAGHADSEDGSSGLPSLRLSEESTLINMIEESTLINKPGFRSSSWLSCCASAAPFYALTSRTGLESNTVVSLQCDGSPGIEL